MGIFIEYSSNAIMAKEIGKITLNMCLKKKLRI